ncbi:MAG: thiol-activated cytolysin family protein [Prevotellaceae bacterium]|nr:thiol-activated cytolysin family protein [Prevotellaceae bacterium]
MKKLLILTGLALLFNACEKGIDIDMEALEKERLTAISDYLNSINMLDTVPVTGVVEDTISRTEGSAVLLWPPYTPTSDYYIPVTTETQKFGNDLTGNSLSFQSIDAVWPGNLIQGISVRDNRLATAPLSSYRKPGRIYLDLVSGQAGMNYTHDIAEFTGSCVTQAMNEILAPYTSGFPARFSYSQKLVHSSEEMAFYLDMNNDDFDLQTGGSFQSVNWSRTDKTWIMIKLQQIYFTMSYDFPGIDSLFNDEMKAEYLKPYVYENNPLCYISSVSYGRYFVLLYEIDSKYTLAAETLGKIFDPDSDESLNSMDVNTYHAASIRMVQIGGNATDGLEVIYSATALRNFIINGSVFSRDNVGAPIYYTLMYVNNSRSVVTYKDINVNCRDVDYYEAAKVNNVEITLQSIYSNKLTMQGGNGHLCNRSKFSVSSVNIYVSNSENSENPEEITGWTLIRSIPTGITNVLTEPYATSKSYYITASTGELGINTSRQIKISFSVSYTNVRRIHYIIGSDDYPSQTVTYNKEVLFAFDRSSQRWKVIHNDAAGGTLSNTPFRTVKFTDGFNYCNIGFQLSYSFKANYRTY